MVVLLVVVDTLAVLVAGDDQSSQVEGLMAVLLVVVDILVVLVAGNEQPSKVEGLMVQETTMNNNILQSAATVQPTGAAQSTQFPPPPGDPRHLPSRVSSLLAETTKHRSDVCLSVCPVYITLH